MVLGLLPGLSIAATTPAAPSVKADTDSKHGKTCISEGCHAVPVTGITVKHSPYLEGQCLQCHEDHTSTAPGLLKKTGNEMCLPCHSAVEMKGKFGNLVHPPVEKTCTDCHNPHESGVRNLLRDSGQLRECAGCHADFLKQAKERPYRHKFFDPVTECGNCHYAHKHSGDKYLRRNLTESCLTCHDISIQTEGRALENVGQELANSKVVHPAMEVSGCQTCHNPHGADQPALLRSGYPAGKYEPYKTSDYELCWHCHDSALVESEKGEGITQFRNGERNLHRVHLVELKRGRACHVCHTAHASDTPHLLREEIRFNQWVAPLKYTLLADGGACSTPCHTEKEYRHSATPILRKASAASAP